MTKRKGAKAKLTKKTPKRQAARVSTAILRPNESKPLSYAQKARQLREFGFPVKYGKRGKTKPRDKSAVTRQWKKVEKYVENQKQKFIWQPATKKDSKKIKAGIGKHAMTPNGFFLKVPRGVRKAPKIRVREKDGAVTFEATGKNGGRVKEIIHRVNPLLLAEDAEQVVIEMVGDDPYPPDDVALTVNGFDSPMTEDYDLETLASYLVYDLFPRLRDPNISEAQRRKHGKKPMTDDEIAEIFHLKFSYFSRGKKRKNTRRRR